MLEINHMSKSFTVHVRGGIQLSSFDDVSFTVRPKTLLAVTGPSGIGKSSLLKCIYRTYLPSAGEAWYTDAQGVRQDLASADERTIICLRNTQMGYVSQFFHVLPRVPAVEVLMEPLLSRGTDAAEARERACELLSRVGLGKTLWDMYPSTFSGGEKQRLNILQAIIARPRLLLLDEPTASLDAGYKARVMDLILELKSFGTTMVGIFHDKDALRALSDDQFDLEEHVTASRKGSVV